jgi:hypothetical protein
MAAGGRRLPNQSIQGSGFCTRDGARRRIGSPGVGARRHARTSQSRRVRRRGALLARDPGNRPREARGNAGREGAGGSTARERGRAAESR